MQDLVPTMRNAMLGRMLRKHMRTKGMWASELARKLGVSPSKVSRMLSGKRPGNLADVGGFAALCELTSVDRDLVIHLAQNTNVEPWVELYRSAVPEEPEMILHTEQTAQRVTIFEPATVPDLLQVADYTRALLRSHPLVVDREIEQRVALRQGRQQALNLDTAPAYIIDDESETNNPQPPTQFQFLLSEQAVRWPVANPKIMCAQLRHLLRTGVQPNVQIRIIPTVNQIITADHSFYLCDFDEQLSAACLIHLNAITILEDTATVNGYRRLVAALETSALDTDRSRAFLSAGVHKLSAEIEDGGSSPFETSTPQITCQ
jgi:transcriptional regulator with XRE-family HTH domain